MFHIGQQPGRFIAGRLDHPAIELCPGRRHEVVPRGLITGLSELFHNNEVALGVHRYDAQAAGTRFVLGHREFLGGLTLGDALSAQCSVLFKEVRTFESLPAWLATLVAVWHVLDDGSHSDLLCQSLAL